MQSQIVQELITAQIATGSDNYYRIRFMPKQQRLIASLVTALFQTIINIPYQSSDANIAQQKINFWREELLRLARHNPTHPFTQQLQLHLSSHTLAQIQPLLNDIPSIAELLLHAQYYQDADQQLHYFHQRFGLLEILLAALITELTPTVIEICHDIGCAIGQITIINQLRREMAKGAIPIADDDLTHYKIDRKTVFDLSMTQPLSMLLAELINRANQYYDNANRKATESIYQTLLGNFIAGKLAILLGNELVNANFPIFEAQLALTPIRRLFAAIKVYYLKN